MRKLSASLDAKLESGVTHLCWCWKLLREDGTVFGFTDHDKDLSFDGVQWKAAAGIAPGMVETNMGFETGSAGTAGSVFHDLILEQDLREGKFDGARAEIWRVDWQNPDDRVGLWAGEIGEVQFDRTGFRAELVSNTRKLERVIGRTFSKTCDAELGDDRCNKDISVAPWRFSVVVDAVIGPAAFSVKDLILPEDNWLVFGKVEWVDAQKIGFHARIDSHFTTEDTTIIELLLPPTGAIEAGDIIELVAGCDKSLGHCSGKFSNVDNFRGCPFMPGNDALLATPFVQN